MVKPDYNNAFVDLCSESFQWPVPSLVFNLYFLLWKKTIRNYPYLTVWSGSWTLDSRWNLVFPAEPRFLLPYPVWHLPFLRSGNWLFSELALGLADWFYCVIRRLDALTSTKSRALRISFIFFVPVFILVPIDLLFLLFSFTLTFFYSFSFGLNPLLSNFHNKWSFNLWTLLWTKPILQSKLFIRICIILPLPSDKSY